MGCRASGGAKTRAAGAAPREKGVRTEGAGRLPAGAGARRRDDAVTPGPSANTPWGVAGPAGPRARPQRLQPGARGEGRGGGKEAPHPLTPPPVSAQ